MCTFTTRPLTADETETLLRKLTIALGVNGKDAALRAIAEIDGVGIFAVEDHGTPAVAQTRSKHSPGEWVWWNTPPNVSMKQHGVEPNSRVHVQIARFSDLGEDAYETDIPGYGWVTVYASEIETVEQTP